MLAEKYISLSAMCCSVVVEVSIGELFQELLRNNREEMVVLHGKATFRGFISAFTPRKCLERTDSWKMNSLHIKGEIHKQQSIISIKRDKDDNP